MFLSSDWVSPSCAVLRLSTLACESEGRPELETAEAVREPVQASSAPKYHRVCSSISRPWLTHHNFPSWMTIGREQRRGWKCPIAHSCVVETATFTDKGAAPLCWSSKKVVLAGSGAGCPSLCPPWVTRQPLTCAVFWVYMAVFEILSFCAAPKGNVPFTTGKTRVRSKQFSHLSNFNLWKTSASPICIPCGLFLLAGLPLLPLSHQLSGNTPHQLGTFHSAELTKPSHCKDFENKSNFREEDCSIFHI